jgi:hypothetical protein
MALVGCHDQTNLDLSFAIKKRSMANRAASGWGSFHFLEPISFPLPALGMFGDPLGGLLFGGETLDYFRLAIWPKNINHPAKSWITFSRHESGSVFEHLANMRLRRAGSSRSSDTIKPTDRNGRRQYCTCESRS